MGGNFSVLRINVFYQKGSFRMLTHIFILTHQSHPNGVLRALRFSCTDLVITNGTLTDRRGYPFFFITGPRINRR